jgi:hypothetical protein
MSVLKGTPRRVHQVRVTSLFYAEDGVVLPQNETKRLIFYFSESQGFNPPEWLVNRLACVWYISYVFVD